MTQTMNIKRLEMEKTDMRLLTCHTVDMKWKSAIVKHKCVTQHGTCIHNPGTKSVSTLKTPQAYKGCTEWHNKQMDCLPQLIVSPCDLQVRGLKKVVFRRLTGKLNILKALDSKDDAKSALVELKKAFTAFQEAHDVVCAPLTDFDEQLKADQEFIDVEQQYTQCLNDINPWLYGTNCDVSYAKPYLAINSSAVNARDTGKSQGDTINCGKQSICLLCHSVHPLYTCCLWKVETLFALTSS